MSETGIVTRSSEATRGGFQAILMVSGILQAPQRVPPGANMTGFGGRDPNDQAKVVLDDAEILEMEEGEPEPELKDGKFTFWMGYAPKGRERPHVNSFYVRGFLKSAEELDAKQRGVDPKDGSLNNLIGTRVTLHRKKVALFKKPREGDPETKEEVFGEGYVFEAEGGIAVNMKDYIANMIVGSNVTATKRLLLVDAKARRYPEYREALDNGSLAELVGLSLVDNVFTKIEGGSTNG